MPLIDKANEYLNTRNNFVNLRGKNTLCLNDELVRLQGVFADPVRDVRENIIQTLHNVT